MTHHILAARSGSRPSAIAGAVAITAPTLAKALAEVMSRAEHGEGFTLFTLNLDHLVKLRESTRFADVYRRANIVTADGWPVVWLARREGVDCERTTGADLVEPVCQGAARAGMPVFFIGPGARAQQGAIASLQARFAELIVAGACAPRLDAEPEAAAVEPLAEEIRASGARLVFVSLGAPKQELVADMLAARCPGVGFLCVGAALDFISGEARRAPEWMRRANLEWLWRMLHDPRRLAWRYVKCGAIFALCAIDALSHRRHPPA
jgi:N-acetylglucosaminyldiphosphoundecaprenol N-acetyl-beta-D-mannosaminyltransferase